MKTFTMLLPLWLWGCLFSFCPSGWAQSVSLSISPDSQIINRGETAIFSLSPTVNQFSQQLFFSIEQTDFPAGAGTINFQPTFLNSPYTDSASLSIETLGTMRPGTYPFVLKAGNGAISGLDTCYLVVEPEACRWQVSHPPNLSSSEPMIGLTAEGDEVLWITATERLIKFDGQAWRSFAYPDNMLATEKAAIDLNGRVLVPTHQGLLVLDGLSWTQFDANNSPLPSSFISSVAVDGDNQWYIATDQGLARFDGSFWTVFDSSFTSLPTNYLTDLVVDQRQTIWGVLPYLFPSAIFAFDGQDFEIYNRPSEEFPCEDSVIYALTVDSDTNLWMATQVGFTKFDGDLKERWKHTLKSPNRFIETDDCTFLLEADDSQLKAGFVHYIYADSQDIWISGSSIGNGDLPFEPEVILKTDSTWESYTIDNSTLPQAAVISMARVGERLWFITHKGPNPWFTEPPTPSSNLGNEATTLSYITCSPFVFTSTALPVALDPLRVFPNPATSHVIVTWEGENRVHTLYVIDRLGRILQTLSQPKRGAEIDLSALSPGLYGIVVEHAGGRVIKQMIKR